MVVVAMGGDRREGKAEVRDIDILRIPIDLPVHLAHSRP